MKRDVKLIIGFDLQALQTPSRDRGIGRYTLNLIEKILELDDIDTFKLFVNDQLPDKPALKLTKNSELVKINYRDSKNSADRIANNIIQTMKYRSSNLDVFFLPSTFEGHPINPGTISPYLDRLNSMFGVVVYDFIPLHFPYHYLKNPVVREVVYRQLRILCQADILFAISEATRKDAITLLGINPKKVVTIWGGISDTICHIDNLPIETINEVKTKHGIMDKFVLYVGGIDLRKNIETSITGFSKIDKSLLDNTSYVIVCQVSEGDRKRLAELARYLGIEKNLVLTGYIPDEELNILYNCCDLFVFPSLMEGLGIPVLEAMKCGCPVITGNNSSLSELVDNDEFLFDSRNKDEIAKAITKMLKNPTLRKKSQDHSLRRSKDFTWEMSAKKVISVIKSLNKDDLEKVSRRSIKKPRIALFTPMPPRMSGISYYSAGLLPFLSKYWDIDIFLADGYVCNDEFLTSNFDFYSYRDFEQLNHVKKYDSMVYQMGNSDHHTYIYDLIKKYPGVVVLHDVFLSNLMYWLFARNKPSLEEFIEEMIYSHGDAGREFGEKLRKDPSSIDEVILKLTMNKRVLDNATWVLVHSDWDKDKILEYTPQFANKITVANQYAPIRMNPLKSEIKKSLGFSKDDFLICSFGFVANTKKIDSVMRNIKDFLKNTPNAKYVLVGDSGARGPYGESIIKMVKDLGLTEQVHFTNFIEDKEYRKYLDICDVCISLRTNTRAGTSASVSHALGAGIPTIISNEGPFASFPDDVSIKIKPGEERNISEILSNLYNNPEKRKWYSENAQKFAQEYLSRDICVQKYLEAVENAMQNKIKVVVSGQN